MAQWSRSSFPFQALASDSDEKANEGLLWTVHVKSFAFQKTSKNNIMFLFFRKRARIFAYKVSDQINAWPKRHRVIFSISRTVDLIPMDLKRYWRGAHVFLFKTLNHVEILRHWETPTDLHTFHWQHRQRPEQGSCVGGWIKYNKMQVSH